MPHKEKKKLSRLQRRERSTEHVDPSKKLKDTEILERTQDPLSYVSHAAETATYTKLKQLSYLGGEKAPFNNNNKTN